MGFLNQQWDQVRKGIQAKGTVGPRVLSCETSWVEEGSLFA